MGKYGAVAIKSVQMICQSDGLTPVEAWQGAAEIVFPESESSRAKGCPKSAFLGLCGDGEIKGVASGQYTNSIENKEYALKALSLIREDHSLAKDAGELWRKVTRDKQHNGQMDVVVSLWNAGFFEK